jgi:hypothetical protein
LRKQFADRETFVVKTPSGGFHYYFECDADLHWATKVNNTTIDMITAVNLESITVNLESSTGNIVLITVNLESITGNLVSISSQSQYRVNLESITGNLESITGNIV